jgi:uncharacterized membrane protein YfcA
LDLDLFQLAIIITAGILTGVINTLAGSGSLVTLPIFIFLCGLPPTVANGTNRIGVMIQTAVAIFTFKKHGNLPLEGVGWLIGPAIIGSVLGAWVAVDMSDDSMNLLIGFLMVFMLLVLFLKPARWLRPSAHSAENNKKPLTILAFFLIGVYGGLIQAGVGIFLLSALVLAAKYDLIKGNAVKLLAVLLFNIPAFAIFLWEGKVHWEYGLLMAAAQAVGAVIGAYFANHYPKANVWIRYLLILIVIVSALKFFGLYDWVIHGQTPALLSLQK